MKKTIMMIVTAAAAALALNVAGGSKVSAATNQDTTAKVTLTAGKNSNGTDGIILKSAPSYDFGSLPLGTDGNAKTTDGSTTKTIDGVDPVTVENPGIAATWAVSVNMGAFTGNTTDDQGKETANDVTLAGATLDITSTGVTNTTTTDASLLPVAKSFTLAGDGKGAAKDILVASKAGSAFQGIGTTNEATSATINVPAGNVAGNYKATLTWTLAADPTSALEVTK